MNHKYTFGPVVSRRLGLSLGIDLVPRKKCNLDCLYCEVCPTDKLDEDRIFYVDMPTLIKEIKDVNTEIDFLTLTGSGEPTLHKELDKMISALKQEFSYPIVMLTNSLLLRKEEVRKELLGLDLIVPSLDAVSQAVFKKINRPVKDVYAEDVVNGLIEFRKIFVGKMWLEILFVKGINDSLSEIALLSEAIVKIQPDRVQLNTVARPPAYGVALPLSFEELQSVANQLNFKDIDIIGVQKKNSIGNKLTEEAVIDYLIRRPAVFEELLTAFSSEARELREFLIELEVKNKIIKEVHNGMVFFKVNS
ncbi:MAG: radical SAM protein [Candidatus Riflemargulisbacteria bacterium]